MKRTTYQVPELRDENDNIIQQGAFGKNTALANSTNDGWIDYVANDLMYLYNNTMGGTGGEINTETITGKTGTITNLTATTVKADTLTADALNGPLTGDVTGNLTGNVTGNVTGDVTGDLNGNVTGDVTGNLTGNVKGNLTGNVAGTADKAVADGKGNNIVNTYVTKSDLSSSLSTTSLTVSGETSVPTANAGNSSKAIANTEYVQGELTNYLPLSGGTMTGSIQYVENGKVFAIENTGIGAVDLGWSYDNREGAGLELRSTDHSNPGEFILFARGANNTCYLTGMPDGSLTWNNQPLLPVGVVQAFAGSTIPTGWLLCDGSAVSRTTYANLYACIGTTYGAGNGSTTFNLPNLTDKFIQGSATAGTVKSAGLPNITGNTDGAVTGQGKVNNNGDKALFVSQTGISGAWQKISSTDRNSDRSIGFDASRSSAIYGNSTTVQPPALTMRYIIKY